MFAVAIAVLTGTTAGSASSEVRSAGKTWCGPGRNSDWLCAVSAGVSVRYPATVGYTDVKRGRVIVIPGASEVRLRAGAQARMTFARDARCGFGYGRFTDIVTRYNEPEWLFRQDAGISWCSFARGSTKSLPFFCEGDQTCPVFVTADGKFRIHTSDPVVFDVCTGRLEVTTQTASALVAASRANYFHVVIYSSGSIVITTSGNGPCKAAPPI